MIRFVARGFRAAVLQSLATGLLATVVAGPVDEHKPYGRVCIGMVTGDTEEPLQQTEKALKDSSSPRADSHLVVHADANERCQMLVFAWHVRDGKLAQDLLPQLVLELPPWQEVLLPEPPGIWKWSMDSERIDVYVLFMSPNSEEARELKTLITAMLNPMVDKELLDRQSVKLRELATRSCGGENIKVLKLRRVEVATTYRGSIFPWRDYASKANFSEVQPSLFIFRIGD